MTHPFHREQLDGRIALLTLDLPDKRVNTLSRAVLRELDDLTAELERRDDLRGLLLRGGKPGNFIAGADLNELAMLPELPEEQIEELLKTGHELFGRLSNLPFPTVALIDGACMGGGTELILALDQALASTNRKTQIGLPEVKIGLLPAWGGTQRLPRRIGVYHAIQMICSGDAVAPQRAAELGLVFDAVPEDRLLDEGRRLVEELGQSGEWRAERDRRNGPVGLSEDEATFMFATADGYLKGKMNKDHYPAPFAALKAIREGCNRPLNLGLNIERQTALEVFGKTISANLISVFFMQNRLDRDPGVEDPSIKPGTVQRTGVLGAGLMGAGIASAHTRRGLPTAMVDVDENQLDAGLQRCRDVVEKRIKIGRATPEDTAEMFARLGTSTSTRAFADCDVVVEAVPENEELKTKVYRELGGVLKEDAILATNTSTISITRMAESAPNPERFLGMHFFYPVDRMKLVEVVRGEKTGDEAVATIVALAKRIKKTPIVVRDCAGFLVNRVLFPYMNEALLLLQEGASMEEIDRAAVKFGMPMGPIALHDLVGLDTAWFAGQVIHEAYGDRAVLVPLVGELVGAGRRGRKTGAGFYGYDKKGKARPDSEVEPILEKHRTGPRTFTEDELIDRLFVPMLLEATRVLEESIVREPSDVDMGLILGIGFPAFRGGILRWCDTEGAGRIMQRLEPYRSLGRRFEPTETLTRMAKSKEQFYPRPTNGTGNGGR